MVGLVPTRTVSPMLTMPYEEDVKGATFRQRLVVVKIVLLANNLAVPEKVAMSITPLMVPYAMVSPVTIAPDVSTSPLLTVQLGQNAVIFTQLEATVTLAPVLQLTDLPWVELEFEVIVEPT